MLRVCGVVLVVLALHCACADAGTCKLTANGNTIDLSILSVQNMNKNNDWMALDTREKGKFRYFLNVCAPLTTNPCGAPPTSDSATCVIPANATLADYPRFMGDASSADVAWVSTADPTLGAKLTYKSAKYQTIIRFFCGKGAGEPVFIESTDSTYVFEWRTEVLCVNGQALPANETGCTVRNPATGDFYDLSPLIATKMNWMAVDVREKDAYDYELNVCKPLVKNSNLAGDCADAGTAICQTTRSGNQRINPVSLGWSAKPQFRNGLISIATHLGTTCGSFNIPRGAQIDFSCDPNIGLGHPVFNRESRCVYYFDWPSSAACPLRQIQGDHCVVTDPVSGTTYDLSDLHMDKGGYTVSAGGWTYTVNICGGIVGGPCSGAPGACQTDGKNQKFNLGIADTEITFDDGDLTLTYTGGDKCGSTNKLRQTTITFVCKQGEKGQLVFLDEDVNCEYNFAFYTQDACADDEPIQCSVVDDDTGSLYDLTPLIRTNNQPNWDAISKTSGVVRHNLINVCAPLTRTGLALNCSSSLASCSVSDDLKTIRPLGGPAGPQFKEGQLSLEYKQAGGACGSTRIVFNCDPEGGLGKPRFIGTFDDPSGNDCTTLLSWESSVACPVNEIVGSNCAVKDPQSGTNFDLTKLKRDIDYAVRVGDTEYRINVCGTLSTTSKNCNSTGNPYMAACAFKPNDPSSTEIDYGKANYSPVLSDGEVTMEFVKGAACPDGGQDAVYTTLISFVCDLATDGRQGPEFDSMIGSCTALFKWRTNLVCAEDVIECVVENPKTGDIYDLTRLMKYDGNWQANDIRNQHSYIINVCKAVVEDPNNRCPRDIAGCQITKEGVFSIGVPEGPQIDPVSGNLFLEYFGGSGDCRGMWNRTTRIDFVCDKNAGLGQPKFVGEDSFCTYKFQWVSSAACPYEDTIGSGCTVVDPITNDLYNFTSLINPDGYHVYAQVGNDTYDYTLGVCGAIRNVCGPLNGSHASNVAACQYKVNDTLFGFSMGIPPASPKIVNGDIVLKYENGAPCRGNRFQRSTTIIFECDEDAGQGSPVFESEGADCSYYFRWKTSLACRPVPEAIDCRTTNYQTRESYDLSPLMRNRRNWVARNDAKSTEYQINVCRQLVFGSHQCGNNMAACDVDNNVLSADRDMGKPRGPYVNADGVLVLVYPSGAQCKTNPSTKSSTYIEFTCPTESNGDPIPGIIGEPVFLYETSGCVAHFTWRTSYACPLSQVSGRDCKVVDLLSGDTFDLSVLTKKDGDSYHVVNQDSRKFDYHINICDKAGKPCVGGSAGICQTRQGDAKFNMNLGLPNTSPVFDDGLITLTMTNGTGPCGVNKSGRTTTINFVCDRNATASAPAKIKFLGEQEDCSYNFEWATSAACHSSRERECTAKDPNTGAVYDLSSLMNDRENWLAEDSREDNKYAYAINVCRTLVPMANYPDCGPLSAACQISKVDNTFLERPMGEYNGPQFANGQLFIEYTNGAVCSNGMPRTTRINFFCGDTVGEPIYIQETSDCKYEFIWITSAACSTNGAGPTLPTPQSSNCYVTDPVSGLDYDLSPLRGFNKTARNNDPLDNTVQALTVSACGAIPCGSGTAGACATFPDQTSVSLGVANDSPRIISNSIQLSYTSGDFCPNGKRRSTLIIFTCDRRYTPETSTPEFQDETDDCVYIFRWPVNTVCDPVRVSTPCVARDFMKGETYDLSVLTRTPEKGNWLAINSKQDGNAYYINVCHTLMDVKTDPTRRCRGSAVCQTNPANPSLPVNPLGQLGYGPRVINGVIRLEYSVPFSNDVNVLCGPNKKPRKTIITFSCKPGTLGRPVLDEITDDCEYLFSWETSAACSSKRVVGSECKVQDPISGLQFDLSNLKGTTMKVNQDDYLYYVTACGSVQSTSDAPENCRGAGACQTKTSNPNFLFQMGAGNTALTYADGQLTAEYKNGPVCHKGTPRESNRSTIIVFECDHSTSGLGSGDVIFESESDECTYYFTWKTKYACRYKDEVECTLYDKASGRLYDLTPLQKQVGNWLAVSNSHQGKFNYSMNVCHSLNPETPPTGCNTEAGICQVGDTAINLGGVNEPSFENGTLVMKYDNGDADRCPDKGVRTAKITFICGESKFGKSFPLGRPEFAGEFTTCDYDFTWTTPAACPIDATIGQGCKLTDPDTGDLYDLNELGKKTWFVSAGGHSYSITACGAVNPACPPDKRAGACQQASNSNYYSLGQASSDIIYQGGAMHLRYTGGTVCHGVYNRQTTINFVCDPCVKPGTEGPKFLIEEEDCTYAFIWRTSLVCTKDRINNAKCNSNPTTTSAPPSQSSKHKNNAGTIVGVLIVVIVMIAVIGYVGHKKGILKFSRGFKYSRVSHHTSADGINEDVSSEEEI